MTIQKADVTSIAVQQEISVEVWQRVNEKSVYTINFRGNAMSNFSAEGAQELYAQCVQRNLCPQIELKSANDKVVEGNWIVDAVFYATDPVTGVRYTIDARGSEPYQGTQSDPLSVANRKAMGKALRNAHIKAVPLVVREAYLAHIKSQTGKDVYMSEEYNPATFPQPNKPAPQVATFSPEKQMELASVPKARTRKPATTQPKEKKPHEIVYEHISSLGFNTVDFNNILYIALGNTALPLFLEEHSPAYAIELINTHLGKQNSPDEPDKPEQPEESVLIWNPEDATEINQQEEEPDGR